LTKYYLSVATNNVAISTGKDMIEQESLLNADAELLELDDDDDDDLFIKPVKKHKILMISDHPLATSGVGVQSRVLIDGLIATGKFTFRCLGAAMKHQDHRTVQVNPDFIVKPIEGFGNKPMIRQLLLTEKPDAILIFTDPRQFTWLWEMEDEIHQLCPIAYWHVWDNDPYPAFNNVWYESTDLINCLSQKTYDLVSEQHKDKTHYIPHAFPETLYYKMPQEVVSKNLSANFKGREDWFKVLWVNRNATRKVPGDVLVCWKHFLKELEEKHGHSNALLIMHTDPRDIEGPNLLAVAEALELQDKVWFSTDKLSFENMNMLHNVTDCCLNIAKAEGFGLSTLISMQVGKPIIALKTGGETSKVVDKYDGSHHGVALDPIKRVLVGSQLVPYIYEDIAGTQDTVDALMTIFEMTPEQKSAMSDKCIAYVRKEFNVQNVVDKWSTTLEECIVNFKKSGKENKWTMTEIITNPQLQGERPDGTVPATEAPSAQDAPTKKHGKTRKRSIKSIDVNSL